MNDDVNSIDTKAKTSKKKTSRLKIDTDGMLKPDLNAKTNELFDRLVSIPCKIYELPQ